MKCCFLKQIIATHRSNLPQMFSKQVFLEISLYSQKNICVGVSFYRCFPINIAKFRRTDFSYRTPMVAASELESNIRLATQILTKTKRRYFYILIIAKQTKQIFLKRYDFFIHFNINENLKKINEKNRCFKPV